jgi:hypothetical protein
VLKLFPTDYLCRSISKKNTVDCVAISVGAQLESVAIFIEDVDQVVHVIDEEFDLLELESSMQVGEKHRDGWFFCGLEIAEDARIRSFADRQRRTASSHPR